MKTATKKIVLTKNGKINKNIENAIQNCRIEGNKIYTDFWLRNGRNFSLKSYGQTIESILNSQSYKFKKGNDAPKNGEEGNFIQVSKIAKNFLISLKNENKP